MKHIIWIAAVITIFGCKARHLGMPVDRTDPESTAVASLKAYHEKDLVKLKSLSTVENAKAIDALEMDQDLLSSRQIFSGWRWDMVDKWDGTIKEIRIEMSTKTIYAAFYEPEEIKEDTKIGVVSLALEGGQWSFVDIYASTRKDYETLFAVE